MLTIEQCKILNARLDLLCEKILKGDRPTIVINNRLRTTAGRAYYETGVIELNPKIDFEFLLADTLPHEFAHILSWRIYGERGHGEGWRKLCHNLGMKEVNRCHDQDVSAHAVKQRRWVYVCGCRKHNVATVTHNRIQRKEKVYKCSDCNTVISYTGKQA